jgi:hypothetical protein
MTTNAWSDLIVVHGQDDVTTTTTTTTTDPAASDLSMLTHVFQTSCNVAGPLIQLSGQCDAMDGGELEATEDPLFATDKEIGTAGEEAATTAGGAGRQAIVGTPSEEGSLINHAHDLLRTITESITTGEFAAVPTNASTAKFSQHHSQTTTHDEGGLLPLVSSPQDAKDGGEREDIGDLLFTTDGGVSHHCKASSHDDGPRAFVSGQHGANDGGEGYGDYENHLFMIIGGGGGGGLTENGNTSSGRGKLGEELLTPAIPTRVFSTAPASASTKFSHPSQVSHVEEGPLPLVSSPHDAKKNGYERENIVLLNFVTVGGASHHCKASSHDDGPRAFVSGQHGANDGGGGYGDTVKQPFMIIGGLMEKGDTSSGCGIFGEELLTPAITTRVYSAAPASASTKFSHLSQVSHVEEGLLLLVSSPHDAKKDGDERENIVYPHFITVGGASHHCKASSHDDGPRAFVSGQNSANDRGGGYGDNQLFMFIGGGGGGGGGGDPTENDVNRWSTLFIMVCFERCPWLSCAFLFTFSRSHLHIGHILSSFSWQLHSS